MRKQCMWETHEKLNNCSIVLVEMYKSWGQRCVIKRTWSKKHKRESGKWWPINTRWIIKMSQIFCLRKDTSSKPRQNCFGNWIEHCLHYSYLSRQWLQSRGHWEILDEEGTLIKSIYQKWFSPEQLYHSRSRFSKKLMVSVRVSWNRKTNIFFIDLQKTKVDQNCYIDLLKTSLLPECRWHYPGNDFEFLQDSVPSHRTKVTQQFLRQNTPDFTAADESALYSADLNPKNYST